MPDVLVVLGNRAVTAEQAGLFSSDRTIAEYNKDIWHLGE